MNVLLMYLTIEYLRTDIPCLSEACSSQCENEGYPTLLSLTAQHYIIPDTSVHDYLFVV